MNLQKRIQIFNRLQSYLRSNEEAWQEIKQRTTVHNGWFTPEFIDLAVTNICDQFLPTEKLAAWAAHYHLDDNIGGKNIGIVMAGNIPLVGFHDFLCIFICGHRQTIKLSSKDDILLKHLAGKMIEWEPAVQERIAFADMLKGCDAYIATGSNNSARYFEQYFARYPSIIRKNRTSVAIISGHETEEELRHLSDDIHQYFGLGCRNVTRLLVPEGYDFVPLLKAFDKYTYFSDHHKYKNNYDYQLSILLMNKVFYMTNGTTLLVESDDNFSAISRVNYSYYRHPDEPGSLLQGNDEIQCITGNSVLPFGKAQSPGLSDYADGVDTMQFLLSV